MKLLSAEPDSLNDVLPLYPPALVLEFKIPTEVFVGSCASCSNLVYSRDEHRVSGPVDSPEITCGECVAEELTWKKPSCCGSWRAA